MKKIITLIALTAFVTSTGFATVRTVSNHPAGGSQYSTLQAAYNDSSTGDTLVLEGTDIPYFMSGCNPWSKSLTVIGIGFNPGKQIPKRTKISIMDCHSNFHLGTSGSGSSFYGIEFTHGVYAVSSPLNNILFENCKFNSVFDFQCNPTTNFAFRNCIFDRDNAANLYFGQCGTSATGIISNCVFDGFIEGNNSALAAVVFEHCLFLNTSGIPQSFNNVRYAEIRNNIFVNRFPTGTFSSNYQNNICAVAGSFPPSPANGNTASGNIENTNPLFVTYTTGELYSNLHDYDVQAGSAATTAATNGTDIGIHGGYTNFSELGETLINPIIRAMTILNTSVASNGTLNVQLHAAKPASN